MLGCYIQPDLKWHKQISELQDKLKKRLVGLAHIKIILPFSTRKVLVYCCLYLEDGISKKSRTYKFCKIMQLGQ